MFEFKYLLPATILGLMPVARTNLGSLPYPSSLLWKARAKESNRLTQTVVSLHTIDFTKSDGVMLLEKCITKWILGG